ncbi:MAG TPA: glycoside hydrolase family 3 N-terminal domain-containing protein [Pyrinomonadaceae bacterium]|nr:glycoside hydrolase family 3 N-terminal domain-containing protein [Pyrinomonadaceae bacterium]
MKTDRTTALRLVAVLVVLVLLVTSAQISPRSVAAKERQIKPYTITPTKDAQKWADKQLKKMSIDEKIGQLIYVGVNATYLSQDSDAFRALSHHVVENHIGGIILFRGPVYESVVLVNRMQELSKYPLLISADLEAGAGMRFDDTVNFPWNMAVAATGNPEYARRQGEITAREARALGIQQIYAPVVDVNNNAANPVINVRSYGEDPADVARFAAAFTEGAQRGGVIATAKHFPGHGDTAVDSHRGLPEIDVDRNRLNSVELVPFRASVEAGVGAVMVGHIGLPQVDPTVVKPLPKNVKGKPVDTSEAGEIETTGTMPATMSPVLGGILRNDLHFNGMIVTDALSMSGLTIYFTPEETAVRALEAGADLLLKPTDADAAVRGLQAAVRSGRISEARLDESVRKVMAAKYDLGLKDNRFAEVDVIDRVVGSREVMDLAREIAEHTITLVKNEDNVLPLGIPKADVKIFNLAVTNGDDRLVVANPFVTTMNRAGVKMETMVLDDRSSDKDVQTVLDRAQAADIVIASLYGRVRSGEMRSVGLPEPGRKALNALIEKRARLVPISFGNPYLLMNFPELRTYLVAYGDMPSLQQAAARAVLGQIDISGRLPISLPGLYPRGTGLQLKKVGQ